MSRWLEIFKDNRLYEIKEGQPIKVIETLRKVRSLIDRSLLVELLVMKL